MSKCPVVNSVFPQHCTHTHKFNHPLLVLLLLHLEPQIRGNKTEEFENKSPVRVCVDLRGATQSTSQNITIKFTPQLKDSATNPATCKNMKLYFIIYKCLPPAFHTPYNYISHFTISKYTS